MRTFISIIAISFGICTCVALEPSNPAPFPTVTNELRAVTCFAFGGVGIAGMTSQGELAFRAVLAGTNPLTYFRATLTNGTTAAKLYALCGIRVLAPPDFNRDALPLSASDAIAVTMSGCLVYREQAAAVVGRIKGGTYDKYLKPRAVPAEK
jgi:hypothetical protein